MKQLKYDIVVIGGGIGGLTSAALLTKAGYKTLVVEKLPFAGGRCTTLDYHGYKLTTGAVIFEEEIHGDLCREVGAEFELHVPDPIYYYRLKGKDYPVPSPGVLKTMFREASQDDAEVDRVWKAFKRSLTWAEPSYSMSVHDWLKQYTDNPAILGIFQSTVGIMTGMLLSEVPAGEYFHMVKETAFIKNAGFLPQGGSSLIGALLRAIERMGGEVWTHCQALQIKVKDEIATGVVIRKDKEEIELITQAVISNAGPRPTVELLGREHFSPGYLKDVEVIKSVPGIAIHVACDRLLLEGFATLTVPGSRRLCDVFNYPNTIFPNMAPKGKHLLTCFSYVTSSKPSYDFNKDVEITLQELRDNIPDFDKYTQILRVNTYHGYWGEMRTWAGYSLPVKTPIEKLYLVGDASAPLGWWGAVAAVKSARLAVEDVSQRFKPA